MKFFFSSSPLHTEKFQHRFVNVHSFYLVFYNYFDPIHLITEDAFRQYLKNILLLILYWLFAQII